ncbi:carboxypeptidase-like regulatory domain-containing protein [Zobellia nedashkovskayae]
MFKFKMKICFLLASFILFQLSANEVMSQEKSSSTNTQQNQVSGVVKDSDGIVLPGANVLVKGTTVGTQTDFDGNYTIEASAEDTLIFSYIGYTEQSILVGNQSSINVSLVADSQELDEIIVIGYGSQKKSLVTGAITSIDSKALSNNTFTRAEQALQGRTPGVYVVPNSGAPGASPKVRIRGVSSNGNAESSIYC